MKQAIIFSLILLFSSSLWAQKKDTLKQGDPVTADSIQLDGDTLPVTEAPAADTLPKFKSVNIPFETLVECDGKLSTLGWNLQGLDSLEAPYSFYLFRLKNKTDSIPVLVHEFDSGYLAVHSDYQVKRSGYYYLEAIDSSRSLHYLSPKIFVDFCNEYQLPEKFKYAPDKTYTPVSNLNIEKVEMVIFNSSGDQVFYTEDPAINWDGRNQETGTLCPPGTYFYNCDVFENKRGGLVKKNITGIIQLTH